MPRWGVCARGMAQARALRPARLLTHWLTARATTLSVRTTDQGRSVVKSDHGLGSKWRGPRAHFTDPRCRTVHNGCKPLHAHSSCLGTTASGQHWGAPITVPVGEPTPPVPAHLRTCLLALGPKLTEAEAPIILDPNRRGHGLERPPLLNYPWGGAYDGELVSYRATRSDLTAAEVRSD